MNASPESWAETHPPVEPGSELVLSYDDKPEYYQLYERYIRRASSGWQHVSTEPDPIQGVPALRPDAPIWRCAKRDASSAWPPRTCFPTSERHVHLLRPDYADRSLGTFAILSQLELARRTGRQWLYLGYLVRSAAR